MKILVILLIVALLCLSALGQEMETPASHEIIASWLDYANYRLEKYPDLVLVEFYYGLLRHQLTFEDLDTIFEANAYVWLEIFDDKGKVIDTLSKKIVTRVSNRHEIGNRSFRILDALQALMKPGDYVVHLIIQDANSLDKDQSGSGKIAERQLKITVPKFPTNLLCLSDLELAYKIKMLAEPDTLSELNPLIKGNRQVVPNPSRIFTNADSMMYFYAEVYNLKFNMDEKKEYYINYQIKDNNGAIIADYGQRKYFKPGTSAVISSAIDISDLPEGRFTFVLQVTDGQDNSQAQVSKEFVLLYQTAELAPAVTTEDFTAKDAELMEKVITYYTTKAEMDQYKRADLEGKKEFLKRFWQMNDPDTSTRLNEFKSEAFRRFAYVNEKFSVKMMDKSDGWKTDRGRIYMIYGPPDEIESHPSSPTLAPFERWNYFNARQQGNIFFIFVDETGFGDYVLRHSNAKGEVSDPKWEQMLQTLDPFKTE